MPLAPAGLQPSTGSVEDSPAADPVHAALSATLTAGMSDIVHAESDDELEPVASQSGAKKRKASEEDDLAEHPKRVRVQGRGSNGEESIGRLGEAPLRHAEQEEKEYRNYWGIWAGPSLLSLL